MGLSGYFSPNTISTRFLGCVRLLADYFWESLSMKKLATSIIAVRHAFHGIVGDSFVRRRHLRRQPGQRRIPARGSHRPGLRLPRSQADRAEARGRRRKPRCADHRRDGRHQFADGHRQVQRRQGPQGRAERCAEGDHQAGAQRSGRGGDADKTSGAEEGRGPGLQDRRRSLAPGVRQRRPHPDRQHQGLSVQRHRLSRIEGREGQLRKLLGDADRPVDGADGRALPLQPRRRRLAGGHVLRARPQRLDRGRRSVRRLRI